MKQTCLLKYLLLILLGLPQWALAQELMFQDVLLNEDVLNIQSLSFDQESTGVFNEQRAAGYVPLYSKNNNSLIGFVRGQRVKLNKEFYVPDRNFTTPKEFGNLETGLGWRKTKDNGTRYSVSGSIGTTGRQIFASSYPPTYSITASMERRYSNDRSWLFFLIGGYQNNRGGMVPGFGYVIRGPNYRFILGLPLVFMMWNPNPLTLILIATPFSIQTEINTPIMKDTVVYGAFNWDSKEYYNLVSNSKDRLFFRGEQISTGVKYTYNKNAEIALGYMYGFSRHLFIGSSSTQDKSHSVTVPDGGGLQLKINYRF